MAAYNPALYNDEDEDEYYEVKREPKVTFRKSHKKRITFGPVVEYHAHYQEPVTLMTFFSFDVFFDHRTTE